MFGTLLGNSPPDATVEVLVSFVSNKATKNECPFLGVFVVP